MSRWNLAWLLGIGTITIIGIAASHSAPLPQKDKDYELVRLVVDVLSEVDERYVRELTPEAKRKLVEDMINGGLERLDPHTGYINPKKWKQFQRDSKGSFFGIGVQISTDRRTNALVVVSPLVGTPAYEAGILAGDLILKIDGKDTENMSVSEAVELIQGEKGQKVTLTVKHEGSNELVDVPIVRDHIKVQSILGDRRKPNCENEWDFFIDRDSKIAYIRINAFNEETAKELNDAINTIQREGARGIILDLRNNPGGLLNVAVHVADLFLTEGRIVSTKGRHMEEDVREAHLDGTVFLPAKQYPMAVLINRFSASASEIVAAALQDHKRAVVIGERSFGKGSVQNVIRMEGGTSALKLTTQSYWRPNGKNIHRFPDAKDTDEWGVSPDEGFEIKLTDEERFDYFVERRNRDIVHGKDGKTPEKKQPKEAEAESEGEPKQDEKKEGEKKDGEKKEEKKPYVDRVLEKAVQHIREQLGKVGMRDAEQVIAPA